MAKVTIKRTFQGRTEKPLEWSNLESLFNLCFGSGKHPLPKFPSAYGAIYSRWVEGDGSRHEADSLDETKAAYENHLTYQVEFGSSILREPPHNLHFEYRPGIGDGELKIATSSAETIDKIQSAFDQLLPLPIGSVFISYDTREIRIADFIKELLQDRLPKGVPVFVAKRDIRGGDDPTRVLIGENLLRSTAIISLCTLYSRSSPWLWWETATGWARDCLVVPLFANITPTEFDGPIELLLQGRSLFDEPELNQALTEICKYVAPKCEVSGLTDAERRRYKTLRRWHAQLHSK